jgi:hypothetical protein
MQNLPRKSTIKKAITAPEGHVILGADLSNIELRVGLRIAGQMNKLQLLADGQDLYKDFASGVFKIGYDEVDEEKRFIGKTSQLALIFGTGALKLRTAIKTGSGTDIGDDMSRSIVSLYRTDYFSVKGMWTKGNDVLNAILNNQSMTYGYEGMFSVDGAKGIRLPSGLFMQYPNLRKDVDPDTGDAQWTYAIRGGRDHIYGAKIFQGLTQAVARCIMAEHMLAIQKRYPIALTIHDALYMVVPEDEAERAQRFVVKTMRTPPAWLPDVPLDAEAGYAKTLSIKMSKLPVITEDV